MDIYPTSIILVIVTHPPVSLDNLPGDWVREISSIEGVRAVKRENHREYNVECGYENFPEIKEKVEKIMEKHQ